MSRLTLIDRTLAVFSPERALRRARARAGLALTQAGGYTGASASRRSLRGWGAPRGSADRDTLADLPALRARSRDLYRNASLGSGALNTAKTNVVGSGLRLQARIDRDRLGLDDGAADAWERLVEREFQLWAENPDCDATRTDNFFLLQSLVFLSTLMSGDVFVLLPRIPRPSLPYDLRLQVIEADQVKNPGFGPDTDKLAGGVETDDFGAPIAYYLARTHPGGFGAMGTRACDRIPAFGPRSGRRNVLHLYDRTRPGQRRGAPWLAPVIEDLKQLDRYSEAELMAAVVSGYMTVFIQTEDGGAPLGASFPEEEQVAAQEPDVLELGSGSVVGLAPGETPVMINPSRPNSGFDGFVQSICQSIGAGLEVPHELLTKKFTASYSASRAALLEAWKFFKARRSWLAWKFCQPVYEEWLTEAVLTGRVPAPGFFNDPGLRAAYCRAEWIGPSQGQIDPLKEVNAAVVRVENGFSTRAEETQALTGGDWEAKHRIRAKEERMRTEAGLTAGTVESEGGEDAEADD